MKNNQNYKSRLASLMVLCQLFLLSAVSCGETAVGNPASDDTDAVSGAGSTVESTVLDDKQRAYWEPLKSENMDGYTMNVAVTQELVFRPEEENGDLINDAIFLRNRNVEELYNIHLTETVTKTAAVQSAVLAGDDSYAVCMCPLYRDAANMATGNLLYDIGAIDTLDTEAVWWDQNLLNTTKIGGRQFFLAGDIDYTLYGRTIVLMFNKGKMTEITSDNIYDTVKAGKWTFDAFDKLQKNATRDLNGDSIMDENDSYGIIMSAVHGSYLAK